MTLSDWQKNGWLVEHHPTREEIRDLFTLADRDLKDSQEVGISLDWRFAIAYNATLQSATAALAAAGYRAARENHHFRVLQSLSLTLGLPPQEIRRIDAFRKKRNISDYEIAGAISGVEAQVQRCLHSQWV